MNAQFIAFNADQSRLLVDASNQYDQWVSAKRANNDFYGWMSWRSQNGKDYLISGRGNGGSQKSHGSRSEETEALYRDFTKGKETAKSQLEIIEARLEERAPMMRALRMGRILAPLAQVIREFDVQSMLGDRLLIGGTHAIAGYEALAGQWFDSSLTATEDLDFVWRQSRNIELVVKNGAPALLQHLKAVDSSYTVNTERTFQARNAKGLIIDFISDDAGVSEAPKEYLKPISITGQEWIIQSKPVDVVAIDTRGFPVRMVVPDPRVFALHKAWVSERADRNPLKCAKDMRQAVAVSTLVKCHLPQYPFDDSFLNEMNGELQNTYALHIAPAISAVKSTTGAKM
jgi:hypothetical protein